MFKLTIMQLWQDLRGSSESQIFTIIFNIDSALVLKYFNHVSFNFYMQGFAMVQPHLTAIIKIVNSHVSISFIIGPFSTIFFKNRKVENEKLQK